MSRKNRPRPVKNSRSQQLARSVAGPAVILIAAYIAVWPLMQRGESCGADFSFHFINWLDAQHSFFNGILNPHWANSPNFGAGEPRFVFYPPLTWITGAVLGSFLSWNVVSVAFAFLLFAGTGLAHRALAREVLPEGPAALAGCASIFLGNLLLDTYMRSDYAELSGGIWIPLLLLCFLRFRPTSGTLIARCTTGIAPLSLVIAGIWLTNGPLAIMASYLLMAAAIVSTATQKSWQPAIRAAISFTLGVSLAAVYLLPAVWERGSVNFNAAISQREYLIENGWLFRFHSDPSWSMYNTTLDLHSWLTILMFGIASASLLLAWKRGILRAHPTWWLPVSLIPIAALLMQLPISALIWNHLPALQFLQFPWRWLVVMIPSLAISFAAAVWVQPLPGRIPILAVCGILFLFISAGTWGICYQNCRDLDNALQLAIHQDGVWGKPEYSPPGIRHPLVDRDAPKNCEVSKLAQLSNHPSTDATATATPASACLGTFAEIENLPEHKVFSGTAEHAGLLILNLRNYPAWRISLNGQIVAATTEPAYGLAAVPIQQGPASITADWTTTPDVWIGRIFSTVGLLLLAAVWVSERRRFASRLK